MSAATATALYGRLTAGTTLTALGCTGVYYGVAPEGTAHPYVTISLVTATDSRVFGAKATTREQWAVQAWDKGASHKRCKQLIDAADALLDEYDLPVGAGTAMCCRRIGELPDLSEESKGVVYRQAGARYELEVRA